MKPRPFYRWKSFWLGLCVLVFLGWAWWDSYRNEAVLSLWSGKLQVVRGEGATHFASGGQITGFMPGYFTHRGKPMGIWFWRQMWKGVGHSYATLPDAPAFVSSFALWSAWLFWHWKWEQKKLTA